MTTPTTAYRPATLTTSGTHEFAKAGLLHLFLALGAVAVIAACEATKPVRVRARRWYRRTFGYGIVG